MPRHVPQQTQLSFGNSELRNATIQADNKLGKYQHGCLVPISGKVDIDLRAIFCLVLGSTRSTSDDNQIVLVEMPFSSFELTEEVAEHLGLTQSQKEAIQQVMARERHIMEPLFAQLRSVREKLLPLDVQHSNKKDIKTLADQQAALLARFIVANARMQSEIYKLLTPQQQRKLDDLKRSGESKTVASR